MSSPKYKLSKTGNTPYYSLFASQNAVTEETILARCYGGNFTHNSDAYALVTSKGQAGYTKALAFSYLMADGSRFTDRPGYETMTFTEECAGRDPRMAQTIATQGAIYADGSSAIFNFASTITGYPMLKFVAGPSYTNASTVDMPLYRLAEAYLNYAEAKPRRAPSNRKTSTSRSTSFATAQACPTLSLKTPTPLPTPSSHPSFTDMST